MRKILFRGKGINDKEWRYGFYTEQQGYPYITPDGVAMYEIDANTAGQYTGLNDRNGNRIFEGDIIKHDVTSDTSWEAIVKWDNDGTRFLGFITGNEPRIMYVGMIDKKNKSVIKIVGNIYDNPELLKER